MNKKLSLAAGILVLAVLIAGGYYWYSLHGSLSPRLPHPSAGIATDVPTDCHGDTDRAYWRTDMVNLAYFEKGGKMYYCDIRPGGAPILVSDDPASFELISGGLPKENPLHEKAPVYAKDASRVYGDFFVLYQADPKTFHIIDPIGIAVDAHHIYFGTHMLDSDLWYPNKLQVAWPSYYYRVDETGSPSVLHVFGSINGNAVAMNQFTGEITPMKGIDVDLSSFTVVYGAHEPHLYAKDKNHVYCWYNTETPVVLAGADPLTFRIASKIDIEHLANRAVVDALDFNTAFYQCHQAYP